MNLKSRITKLERATNAGGFCLCFGQLKIEAVLSGGMTGTLMKAPDVCEKCRRPVDKRFIEITFEQYQENVRQRREQAQRTVGLFENSEKNI